MERERLELGTGPTIEECFLPAEDARPTALRLPPPINRARIQHFGFMYCTAGRCNFHRKDKAYAERFLRRIATKGASAMKRAASVVVDSGTGAESEVGTGSPKMKSSITTKSDSG